MSLSDAFWCIYTVVRGLITLQLIPGLTLGTLFLACTAFFLGANIILSFVISGGK